MWGRQTDRQGRKMDKQGIVSDKDRKHKSTLG